MPKPKNVVIAIAAIGLFLVAGIGTSIAHPANVLGGTSPVAQSGHSAMPNFAPSGASPYWAGYLVLAPYGGATNVQANWHVPQIAAACPKITTESSFFVGFNSLTSGGLVAIGTQTNCVAGSAVYAGYYTAGASTIGINLTLSPADNMFGEVKFKSNSFTWILKDLTTGKSFSKTLSGSLPRYSAEWMAGDPHQTAATLYPLTDFGWVTFRNSSATVGGHAHPIGWYGWSKDTMWNVGATKVKVSVGGLSVGGSQFKATWKNRGP